MMKSKQFNNVTIREGEAVFFHEGKLQFLTLENINTSFGINNPSFISISGHLLHEPAKPIRKESPNPKKKEIGFIADYDEI